MAKKRRRAPEPTKRPEKPGSEKKFLTWRRFASLALFVVALGATLVTLDDPGLAWDEPASIVAGRTYVTWMSRLPGSAQLREDIDVHWGNDDRHDPPWYYNNCEHPPLAKALMGISQRLVPRATLIWASRMVVAFLFALLVELVLKVGYSTAGGLAGVTGALSLLCMPRVFGDAHFATLDVAMAFTWLLAVAAFARAVEQGTHRSGALAGLCFGLALLTKINAVFLPLVFLGWGLGFHRKRALWPLAWTLLLGGAVFLVGWPWLWPRPREFDLATALAWLLAAFALAWAIYRGETPWSVLSGFCLGLALLLTGALAAFPVAILVVGALAIARKQAVRPLAQTLLIGLAVCFAGAPWLWPDTTERVLKYLLPSWRVAIPVLYFGRVYAAAPWHYPLVMTLVTIPVGILFLVVVGATRAVRAFRQQPALALALINVAVILGIFMLPGVPKYDGVRLFLPLFPFLAVLAGMGAKAGWEWLAQRSKGRPWRPLLATAVLFLSQTAGIVWFHPFELSYYNGLVAGLWGAHKLGMETTYWHDVVNRDIFRWLTENCDSYDPQKPNIVAFYPVGEQVVATDRRQVDFYEAYYLPDPLTKRNLAKKLQAVRFEHVWPARIPCKFLVLNGREALMRKHEPEALEIFKKRPPLFEVRRQGVLLAGIYRYEPPE